jgi:Fe2+ transport system protein B
MNKRMGMTMEEQRIEAETLHPLSGTCASCPMHDRASLDRLGVDMANWDYVIALAGNPNTGKSTVFNALTGLRQHTGNWPGKTVTRAEGGYRYGQQRYKIVDLPGTYSLLATSLDEEIARDFILFGKPDVTVIVVDATRLERNLNLVMQVLEITERAVVCLNLMDEARRHGLQVDDRRLARDLGVPVGPTSARQGEGMDNLIKAIAGVVTGQIICKPHRLASRPPRLKHTLLQLTDAIQSAYPDLPPYRPPRVLQSIYTSLIDRTIFVLWRAVVFAVPAGAAIWLIANITIGGMSIAEHLINVLNPFGLLLGLNGVILAAYIVAILANEIVIPTVLMLTVLVTGADMGAGAGVMFEFDSSSDTFALLQAGGWTRLTAINLMLFSLVHNPCSTTIYTIYTETQNTRWTVVSALLPLGMGLLLTFFITQLARLVGLA